MKELSIEEKATRYDEALEKSKRLYEQGTITESLCYVFPELAESEDERIRKSVIGFLKTISSLKDGKTVSNEDFDSTEILKWVAWFEKQGEKDEEILILKDQIESLHAAIIALKEVHKIELEKQGEKGTNGNEREIPNSEQMPADKVEPFDKYEGLTNFERTLADICIGWIGQELGWKQYIKDNADALLKIAIKKFNSVQDAIFEKKPADKVIEDEKSLLEKFKQAVCDCAWGKVTCKTEGETQEEYAERWAEQLLSIVRDWADDYIDSREDSIKRRAYDKGKNDTINEQKPAWSEEDELIVAKILCICNDFERSFECSSSSTKVIKEDVDKIDNWLKSIKDKYTWKPSDEQIKALNYVVNIMASSERPTENALYYNILKSLRQQLKKLKE